MASKLPTIKVLSSIGNTSRWANYYDTFGPGSHKYLNVYFSYIVVESVIIIILSVVLNYSMQTFKAGL
mgnify:CR=1 FL=1